MRERQILGAVVAALAALCVGVVSLAAQAPIVADWAAVPYVDDQVHAIPGNSNLVFRFDYALDYMNNTRPVVTVKLLNGYNSGVRFEVWTALGMADTAKGQPVGRGSAVNLDCETGEVKGSGLCISPDLNWAGAFGTAGPYYVNVVNTNKAPAQFQLWIQGMGLGLGQTPVPATAVPSPTPAVPAAGAPLQNVDDPNRAGTIDNQPHTLAANAATWYRFDYANNHMTGQRPSVTLALVRGVDSGVAFQVYAPENIGGWWSNAPTGRGTVQMIDCDTGEPSESGQCQSPDLLWRGNFGADGTYWVRVVNNNNVTATFWLTMTVAQPPPP